ncbi:leucine-rich repeat-containing protein 20 isoform X2 [Hyperolius riggenbachi]|uniref:leucine-rich repeat-containing protein 20 isoform X2 n=1 Tax=Hyperolius riggenbachi TaxID=752182 RepID=UPI0035A3BB5A
MAESVAKVARKVNEAVETGAQHLDLSSCALNSFPTGLYFVMRSVSDKILSISLANNELKTLGGTFFTTFTQLQELNLEGNLLEKLHAEICNLPNLKSINLCRNKFATFPEELIRIPSLETINLESNEITASVTLCPNFPQSPVPCMHSCMKYGIYKVLVV